MVRFLQNEMAERLSATLSDDSARPTASGEVRPVTLTRPLRPLPVSSSLPEVSLLCSVPQVRRPITN
jgi:hypothetical protein